MEAVVKENAKVLVPNKEHKNFTETNEELTKGTIVKGEFKSIKGLRRGEPFSYRVFITDNGEIIYSNKAKEMKATEVTLGADGAVTPTTVNMIPAETFKTSRIVMTLAGAFGGYYYAKKKGNGKSAMKYAIVGGLAGYLAIWAFDKSKSVTVSKSK
jgi:hypothetical protein